MSLHVDHDDFKLYLGNVEEELRALPDGSVHCVVTSPPYYGLRDYGTGEWAGGDPEHEHVAAGGRNSASPAIGGRAHVPGAPHRKGGRVDRCDCGAERIDDQIGLEESLGEYIERMVGVFREVWRVLRDDGTAWLNLGDTWAGGGGGNYGRGISRRSTEDVHITNVRNRKQFLSANAVKAKDKMFVPHRVAIALQDDGWWCRQDNVWHKKNAMPESATDRTTNAHEFIFHLTKKAHYYYDHVAIMEDAVWERWGAQTTAKYTSKESGSKAEMVMRRTKKEIGEAFDTSKKNARSVWEINTVPYPDAHFAVFPPELPTRCIMAGTSEKGCCPTCGAPWARIVEQSENKHPGDSGSNMLQGEVQRGPRAADGKAIGSVIRERHEAGRSTVTTGWEPTCGHEHAEAELVPCVVLDPFMGSGTTAVVARSLGRHSVGVELSPLYADMVAERMRQMGLFT